MTNQVPKRPASLLMYLVSLIAGDDKHPQDGVVDRKLRSDLDATKSSLESLKKRVTTSRGQYRQDSAEMSAFLLKAIAVAEKFRDAVFSQFGHNSDALADYALAKRRKSHKAGSAKAGAESASSKAEKKLRNAQLRRSRAQAELERVKARLSKADAEVTRRETEVALATQVAPPEPPASSEPTSTSGTK